MNRLAGERSPYLLQHAQQSCRLARLERRGVRPCTHREQADLPVDRILDVPLVPRHGTRIIRERRRRGFLNAHFVSIKVDREERPDVDRVYMSFVQATTGQGGWPMSVFLTPDLKPFFGGTYFPPTSKWGRPGFLDLLGELARVWQEDRARVNEAAAELTERLRAQTMGAQSESEVGEPSALDTAVAQFAGAFDARLGGFGQAPKFPRPSELLFLLREHARTGSHRRGRWPLQRCGRWRWAGCAISIGGGFHRYSVDAAVARAALREDALRPGAARARLSRGRAGDGRQLLRVCG